MSEPVMSFLGRGWGFPPTFDKGAGGVEMVSDEQDVRQSMEILLSTRIGERLLQPRYGCDMERFLFEPLDTTLRTYIQALVRDAILYFEPRIVLEKVELRTTDTEGKLEIHVHYLLPTINTRNNLVYPFYLNEGSNPSP